MGGSFDSNRSSGISAPRDRTIAGEQSPGKRTLTEQLQPVQLSGSAAAPQVDPGDGASVQRAAAEGVAGGGGALPHSETIQRLFGRHDVGGIEAHVGGRAADASRAIGAEAYATGHQVAFANQPSLHTAAHEAAHVVQQRGGVQLKGGVGEAGDAHEQHANAVADMVVRGESAEPLLDQVANGAANGSVQAAGVQRFESREHAELGDQVHSAVGVAAAANDSEQKRLASDRFTDGNRSLSLDLRVRNPATGLPTETGAQSVALSYGEMVALSGDFYYSVDNMRMAPAQEVIAIRDLVAAERRDPHGRDFDSAYEAATSWRRAGVYQPGTGSKEGTKGQYWGVQPGDAAHDNASTYLDLATENNSHFSAATGTVASPTGPEGNAAADNQQGFLSDHSRAIAIAQRVREMKKRAGLIPGTAAPASTGTAPTTGGTAPTTGGAAPTTGGTTGSNQAQPGGGTTSTPAPSVSRAGPLPAGGDGNDVATLENLAYVYNAGGDHYLTDAFSAGHLINKAMLAPVTDRVLNAAMFDSMVESLMPYAMREPAALGLSPNQLGTGGGAVGGAVVGFFLGGPIGAIIGGVGGGYAGHKGIQHVVRGKLRDGLSVFKTDANLKHNVGAKLVHDYLNVSGAKIVSKNGRFTYTTKGDGQMDAATKDIAARAVLASRNYIRALMSDSDADLGLAQNADDAWQYTPNVDVTLFTSQMEPILRAELADTSHLWELMKTAVKVQENREKQDKTEKSTAKVAQNDTTGDWGRQPNPRFTRRMILTTESGKP
ncbi:MAG TPA: DUF4157 domain-containing protein [Kofleriaceae bacterium]|nr:DUF4157 domain-containing protein [Kofleriaceae bacterium]